MDIYYPSTTATSDKPPQILFWIYGGGLVSGERTLNAPADLGYAHVGSYFADRGFIVVVPDYRLVPNVTFPGPAEDLRDAMLWVLEHPESLKFPGASIAEPDVESVWVMGHSAGAGHIFTLLALPSLYSSFLHPKIRGAVLLSASYHYFPEDVKTGFDGIAVQYYGSVEEAKLNSSLGLLKQLDGEQGKRVPKLLLVKAERDPGWMLTTGKDFEDELERHPEIEVKKIVAKVHNHLSPVWCLGTGEGEEWATETLEWIRETRL